MPQSIMLRERMPDAAAAIAAGLCFGTQGPRWCCYTQLLKM
jgi:hypothetical protein